MYIYSIHSPLTPMPVYFSKVTPSLLKSLEWLSISSREKILALIKVHKPICSGILFLLFLIYYSLPCLLYSNTRAPEMSPGYSKRAPTSGSLYFLPSSAWNALRSIYLMAHSFISFRLSCSE